MIGHHVQPVGLGYTGAAEIRGISGDARESGPTTRPFPPPTGVLLSPNQAVLPGAHRNAPMTMDEPIRRQLRNIEPMRSAYDFAPLNNPIQMRWRKISCTPFCYLSLQRRRSRSRASDFTARLATTLTCASVRWVCVSLSAPYPAKSLNDFSGRD